MVTVNKRRIYAVSGPHLWRRIQNFYSLDWLPAVTATRGEPARGIRIAVLPDGGEVSEKLLEQGDQFHRYEVVGGPMPVRDFEAKIEVKNLDNNSCELTWQAVFEADGIAEVDAQAVISGVFDGGLEKLTQM